MFSFFVPGQPQGKGRPRHKGKITYTPRKTKEYEKQVVKCFTDKYPKYIPIEENMAVMIGIVAQYKIPKSLSKAKKALIAEGNVYPLVKPDCDNIGKAIMDALNGYAYKDDKQVVNCLIEKKYAVNDEDIGVKVFVGEV